MICCKLFLVRIDIIAREYLPASLSTLSSILFLLLFIKRQYHLESLFEMHSLRTYVPLVLERELTFVLEWQFPALRMRGKKKEIDFQSVYKYSYCFPTADVNLLMRSLFAMDNYSTTCAVWTS